MPDDTLIAAHLDGDETAFPRLVSRYIDAVYRVALRILGNERDAEDTVQETFVKAWRHMKRFRRGENFRPWLLRIGHNSAVDIVRKRREVAFSEFGGDDTGPFSETILDAEALPDEIAARIRDAKELGTLLEKLSAGDREVLLLHYQENLSFREIGEVLGKPLNTVKSTHRRALLALRELLAPKGRPRA